MSTVGLNVRTGFVTEREGSLFFEQVASQREKDPFSFSRTHRKTPGKEQRCDKGERIDALALGESRSCGDGAGRNSSSGHGSEVEGEGGMREADSGLVRSL